MSQRYSKLIYKHRFGLNNSDKLASARTIYIDIQLWFHIHKSLNNKNPYHQFFITNQKNILPNGVTFMYFLLLKFIKMLKAYYIFETGHSFLFFTFFCLTYESVPMTVFESDSPRGRKNRVPYETFMNYLFLITKIFFCEIFGNIFHLYLLVE